MKTFKIIFCYLFFVYSSIHQLYAQEQKTDNSIDSLQLEIREMDSLLFQVAFNTCDLSIFQTILTEDIEFYDDRTGLNTSFKKEIDSFKDKCSKEYSVTRKLIVDQIHPLGSFGAVQTGEHSFHVNDQKVETAKFITIWERKENSWIVKRVVSYDHQSI